MHPTTSRARALRFWLFDFKIGNARLLRIVNEKASHLGT